MFTTGQLPLQRLPRQPKDVGDVLYASEADLDVAVAPSPDVRDVLRYPPWVVDLRKRHIERQSQGPDLGDDIDDVGPGLIGDVELQDVLGHRVVECAELWS